MSAPAYLEARDQLLAAHGDPERMRREFRWPEIETFNWALDYLDVVPPRDRLALIIAKPDGSTATRTYGEITERSNRAANYLRSLGVKRGDAVLMMLPNVIPLWELTIAAFKLGAVVIPSSTLLPAHDVEDRVERGNVRVVVAQPDLADRFAGISADVVRIAVGDAPDGWLSYAEAEAAAAEFTPDGPTRGTDPLLRYFTSGTTSKPKLVEHTHVSYPVGHLITVAWLGLQPGDVHVNISSPGWAKHAWSCLFAPWIAEATVLLIDQPRFDAVGLLEALVRFEVTSFCAPPTVWRMLIQQDMRAYPIKLREVLGAGEPLNPEVMKRVADAWNVTMRDGYGQTETTLQVGTYPGETGVTPGAMGRVSPGYKIDLLDADGEPANEGEICIDLAHRPPSLMTGYVDDPGLTEQATRGGYYHTGDVAKRDASGVLTYVSRTDDVFKSSDYRLSPFEIESVLLEHNAVADAAVVPSLDPVRGSVPKAFVILAQSATPDDATAASILSHCRERLAPFKRVRRIEFTPELPKTVSGKIRRVELRIAEQERPEGAPRNAGEWWEEDLAALTR